MDETTFQIETWTCVREIQGHYIAYGLPNAFNGHETNDFMLWS